MRNMMQKLLQLSKMGLYLVLLCTVGIVNGKSISQIQTAQREKYTIDKRSVRDVQQQKSTNRFTQTTAHLQTKTVKELMEKEDSANYIPYLNIIFDCLVEEQKLKDSHYVFYHTTANEYRVAQDVYNRLYTRKYPNQKVEDFYFLRFTKFNENSPKKFLSNELREYGIVDNYREDKDLGSIAVLLLSANLSLFGNINWKTSSTWKYFLEKFDITKRRIPTREDYQAMMKEFGVTDKYVDELLTLAKEYDEMQNTTALLQIFIPQDKVDDIGYLAWSLGMPRHKESLDWVAKNIKAKGKSIGSGKERENALKELAQRFKENQSDPIFKDLLAGVERGDFSLDAFLKVYCNTPWEIEGIDHVQARLLFTPDGLLNPASGIEFRRYSTVSKENLQKYTKKLDGIMNKILAERGI